MLGFEKKSAKLLVFDRWCVLVMCHKIVMVSGKDTNEWFVLANDVK